MPRDERTFITVHDGIDEHPKIEALSDPAFRLLISTWAWCSRNRTDGKVRAASWVRRGGSKARSDLLAAGLAEMQDCGDVLMHDYLEHQRSAQEIEDLKEKRRAAGSKGGKAKASATADAIPNAKHVAKQTASKPVAESESETDRTRDTSSSRAQKRATRIPKDWEPDPDLIEWQRQQGIPDSTARRELPRFRDYWAGIGGDKARKTDWPATWRNWLRRAEDTQPNGKPKRAPWSDDPNAPTPIWEA